MRRSSGQAAQTFRVRTLRASAAKGVIETGNFVFPCALGRSGTKILKREGDGASPRGKMELLRVLYNPARHSRPGTLLPTSFIRRADGWCDAAGDRNYNRPVCHPYPASSENMWRSDGLYDVVVVLGYNLRPRIRNRGSAIFMHVARSGFKPTEGCIALRLQDLKRLLKVARPGCCVIIGGA